jgi:hypothetical protein
MLQKTYSKFGKFGGDNKKTWFSLDQIIDAS